jgi:8-amino-7-oxononanoate synthase
MEIASRLFDAGFFVPGIRWPTVPRGQERLRVTVSSEHSEEEIDRLVEGVGRAPAVTAS